MFTIPLRLPDAEIVFYPDFLDEQESDRLFTQLTEMIDWRQDWITIYGRSMPQPRLTAWYGDPAKIGTLPRQLRFSSQLGEIWAVIFSRYQVPIGITN